MAAPGAPRWRPPVAPPGGYYDPHAALAAGLAVPVVFAAGARGVGALLTPGAGDADVAPGAAADVPLWLAAALLDRNMARLRALPSLFGEPARRALAADGAAACLRGTHFYAAAAAVSALPGAPDLRPLAAHALRARYAPLLARCLDDPGAARAAAGRAARLAADKASADPRRLLSEEEATLFAAGAAAVADAADWRAQARRRGGGAVALRKRART